MTCYESRMEKLMTRLQSKIAAMSTAEQQFSDQLADRKREVEDLQSKLKQVALPLPDMLAAMFDLFTIITSYRRLFAVDVTLLPSGQG